MILFCGFCDTHMTPIQAESHREEILGRTVTLHNVTLMVCQCGVFMRLNGVAFQLLRAMKQYPEFNDYYWRGDRWSIYPEPAKEKRFIRGRQQ